MHILFFKITVPETCQSFFKFLCEENAVEFSA